MSDLFWLTDGQMERLKKFFSASHWVPRVDDRRVLSGIILFNRNGLRWRDAPAVYGPHKTLYNRWFRWSEMGVFGRIRMELVRQDMLRAPEGATIEEIMAATGWLSHTIRGALSGALKKKLGLEVSSEKEELRGRVYKLPAV